MRVAIPILLLPALTAACGAAKPVKSIGIDAAPFSEADSRIVGAIPDQVIQFRDGSGRNLLALKRTESSQLLADSQTESLITLSARLYRRVQPGESLQQVWEIKDWVSCVGLDVSADFIPEATAITDLNDDGRAEVTVAYRLFCGGGVDPKDLKVIMREGERKYAIRGQSTILVDGEAPYGGQREKDTSLSFAPKVFVDHLEKTWQSVHIERIP